MATPRRDFLTGVIEGFYGQPWSHSERLELFGWMADCKLNTYLYAPKDDLKHRALWREPYSPAEADALARVCRACKDRNIRFVYALSPGLDIRYHSETDRNQLRARFEQMHGLGCQDFALLFDDVPERMEPKDRERWSSFASAQCYTANTLFAWTRERGPDGRFLFCPTPYCGRMAQRKVGGADYLPTVGRELLPEIDVLWTGPEIISREIDVAHVRDLQSVLRRKPLIWDNLHANDYDGRRFYCGPYDGRPPELRDEVQGILANPNNEFPLNYVPLRTLAEFLRGGREWNARAAYLSAMRQWLPHLETIGDGIVLEDLVLFGDCYYLPHQEGPEAEALYALARKLAGHREVEPNDASAFSTTAARLRSFCDRATRLRHRSLFYALSRRIWELREELDLFEHYLEFRSQKPALDTPFRSDSHLPGPYRGGLVARLQRLLELRADGTITPSAICAAKEEI